MKKLLGVLITLVCVNAYSAPREMTTAHQRGEYNTPTHIAVETPVSSSVVIKNGVDTNVKVIGKSYVTDDKGVLRVCYKVKVEGKVGEFIIC